MARIPVVGQSYTAGAVEVDTQRTVNWYVEYSPTGKNSLTLYPTPGTELFTTAGPGPVRAMLPFSDGNLYVVSRNQFLQVDSNGNVILKGTLVSSYGPCSIADNGTEIIIVDGTRGYMYVPTTDTFTSSISVVDPDFPDGADSVVFVDGYFIVNDPNNTNALGFPGAFFISGLYDGLAWTALDYDVAARSPDQIKSIKIINSQPWLIGETTTEVWYNSGNATFPFERVNSATIDWGTIAPQSVAVADNTVLMVSKNAYGQGEVVQSQGYRMVKVSNQAIDTAMQKYTSLSDAIGYIVQYNGHTFYVLTFPTDDKTWLFDLSNGQWTEWSTDGADSRHISNCYAFYGTSHIVGSSLTGKLYYLKSDVYDDDGTAITRLRQTPHIHNQDKAIFGSALSLKFKQGVGNASFPNPQVMLQWSDDGGNTWSSEYWRPILGATGVYSAPSSWTRLGKWIDRVFRIKVTDGVEAVLIDGYLDADLGEEEVVK